MHIEHDGETEDDEYLFGSISNARSMAGFAMPFSSSVDLSDGLFEVMLIKAPPLFIEVQAILATLLAGKTDSPYIKVFQTDHVHIKASENTAWTWDGEYGGTMRETDIHVEKQAIALLLPPKEKAEAIEASNQPIFPE
jgi:diacylglycerol kinase family enzyme